MTNSGKNPNPSEEIVGYVPIEDSTPETYSKLGFKCGLEIHQQLKTQKKLFCRCVAGMYLDPDDFNAEVVRHMRPTLSELGEYDGTALMEFRTKKNITYRLNNKNACTYEIDDTPPFPINPEALKYALEIAQLLETSIVGELHITRKQYLDGSIPTGFQRTAIVGINGNLPLKNKNVGVIQLGLEEDSCREVSDIGHERLYITDRLGMPLIEVVTEPELLTPYEAEEAGNYIRFLTRSSGKVRTGIGAGRQDVNVSITGGTRVEIKGVAHIKWIPQLTHNEAFRQKALLKIAENLQKGSVKKEQWKAQLFKISPDELQKKGIHEAKNGEAAILINLPNFKNLLSFFTQPGKNFSNELSDRLKVIACIEKPNLIHSDSHYSKNISQIIEESDYLKDFNPEDAQLIVWGPEPDMETAFETVEERCKEAFSGVPNETRKSLPDGTTLFERVLPGPDRMYPDTDSAPVSIDNNMIKEATGNRQVSVAQKMKQLKIWGIPQDCWTFILRNNIYSFIEDIIKSKEASSVYTGIIFGQVLKNLVGKYKATGSDIYPEVRNLFETVSQKELPEEIIKYLLPELFNKKHGNCDQLIESREFGKYSESQIIAEIPLLRDEFQKIGYSNGKNSESLWIMGQLKRRALGNIGLKKLREVVDGGAK